MARAVRPTNKNNTSTTNAFSTVARLVLASIRTRATLALVPWNDCRMCPILYSLSWIEIEIATANLILPCYGETCRMQEHASVNVFDE